MMEKIIKKIKKENPKKVYLQAPEGLKKHLQKIAKGLDVDSVISVEPCYGACDLKLNECKKLQCDLYVHLGHNKFYKDIDSNVKILYFPWKMELNFNNWGELDKIKEDKVAIVSTIQYVNELEEIKEKLEERGKEAIVAGQVLGCFYDNLKEIEKDAVLYVGTGKFHPTGIKNEKVYKLDLEKQKIENLEKEMKKLEKIRQWNIAKAKKADVFGVLVSSKPGQFNKEKLEKTKEILNEKNKEFFVFVANNLSKEKMMSFDVECLINTACPRIVEDEFKVPIINADDLKEIL